MTHRLLKPCDWAHEQSSCGVEGRHSNKQHKQLRYI